MVAVSVLIRTIGRQAALKDALDSLKAQTWKDFEAVVVEDGPATLEPFLASYSLSLQGEGKGEGPCPGTDPLHNPPPEGGGDPGSWRRSLGGGIILRYEALGRNKGRSAAGNRALALAQGDYCLFLDEDDILLPDHLRLLVEGARAGNRAIAYSWSQERPVERAADGAIIRAGRFKRTRRERFSLLQLVAGNYIPINAILFRRSLFERAGGFDEDIEWLEDWLLWLRYAALEPDWLCVPAATAVYHVTLGNNAQRRRTFHSWHPKVRERMHAIAVTWPIETLQRDLKSHFRVAIFLRKLYYYLTGYL